MLLFLHDMITDQRILRVTPKDSRTECGTIKWMFETKVQKITNNDNEYTTEKQYDA